MKLSIALLSVFMIIFLAYGCAHENAHQGEAGVVHMDTVITKASSDFYALHLSGKNEVPPKPNVNASGKLFMEVNKDTTKMYFTIYVDSLKNIVEATINYATKNNEGPVIVRLYPARHTDADSLIGQMFSGRLTSGVITEAHLEEGAIGGEMSHLVRLIKHDSVYVQIHTKYMRGGAIRAQVNTNKQGPGAGN